MRKEVQKVMDNWRQSQARRVRLEEVREEIGAMKLDGRALERQWEQAARIYQRYQRNSLRVWWSRATRQLATRRAAALLKFQVLTDDRQTFQRQLGVLEYEQRVLEDQAISDEINRLALRQALRRYPDSAVGTPYAELAQLWTQLDAKATELQEIEEAVDYGSQLRKRINVATKYLQEHVRYRSHRRKGQRKVKVATLTDERMQRFQQLLTTVHNAHGRFEAELRDVYEVQYRCRQRADRQVEELLGTYRKLLTPQVQPSHLRNNRLDRQLTTLKSAVMGLARSLRRDRQALQRELTQLEMAEQEAWVSVV